MSFSVSSRTSSPYSTQPYIESPSYEMFEIMSDTQARFAAVSAEIDKFNRELRQEIAEFQVQLIEKINTIEQQIIPLQERMIHLETAFKEWRTSQLESLKNVYGKLYAQDKKISEIASKVDEILRRMPSAYPAAYYQQQPVRYVYPQ